VAALQAGFGELEIDPTLPTPIEMVRAAHTLGSIAGTVGFPPALQLGHGLEAALIKRDKAANPSSLEALETIRITIAELEEMVRAITRGEPLREASALVAQLEEVYPLAPVGEIEAATPVLAPPPPTDEPLPEDEVDESLLPIFIDEAHDLVSGVNERLAMWSKDPFDTNSMHALARLLHTLKGSARMTGAMRIGALAHRLESSIESAHRAGGADPTLIAALQSDFDDIAEQVDLLQRPKEPEATAPVQPQQTPEFASAAPPEHEAESATNALAAASGPETEGSAMVPAADLPSAPEEEAISFDFAFPEAALRDNVVSLDAARRALAAEPTPELAGAPDSPDTAEPADLDIDLSDVTVPVEPELQAPVDTTEALLPTDIDQPIDIELPIEPALEEPVAIAEPPAAIDLEAPILFEEPVAETIDLDAAIVEEVAEPVTEMPSTPFMAPLQSFMAEPIASPAIEEPAEPFELPPLPSITTEQPLAAEPDLDLGSLALPAQPAAEAAAAVPAESAQEDVLDPDLLPIFLEEAVEIVRAVYEQLGAWQQSPQDSSASHALARSLHTLKGSARMAGAMTLGALTHTLESRAEEASKSGQASSALIEEMRGAFDIIAHVVEGLQRGESLSSMSIEMPAAEQPEAVQPTLVVEPATVAPIALEPAPAAPAPTPIQPVLPAAAPPAAAPQKRDVEAKPMLRVRAELIDGLVTDAGELSIARARIEGEMRGLKQSMLDLTENVIRLRRQLREIEIQAESQMQSRVALATEAHSGFDPLELDRFTRFQEVTRMMAESVNDVATVQQNLLRNLDEANAALAAQGRLNRELQQSLMSVRMVPFSSVSERLARIVRQTAKELGKRADLDVFGSTIELDQNVINRMVGPFEHLLRNAIAHGIESPQQRVEQGKPELGDIRLTLKQEGNEVIIAMEDDGAGLNFSRIREKAIAKGLLAADAPYDERQLTEMIFNSGFSTATEVSQVAGRGVGMDVVMTEVTNLGGRIEVHSVTGKGSTFRIYLPLTLAVTNAVMVRVGARTYAIPASMVDQVQEIKEETLAGIQANRGLDWQGNRYPFHFLPHLLGEPGALPESRRMYWLMMLHSGLQRVAIQVDELLGTHEVVVKNIGPQLARVVGIAGATVLGDGKVALILNPVALSTRAPVITVGRAGPAATDALVAPTEGAAGEAPALQAPPLEFATAPAQEHAIHLPTIMVVDDSLTVRKVTGRLLAREGYQVVTAKDGVDALEQLTEIVPDVILSDIEMPRMDGFELARSIRNDHRLARIPIVMISSRTADKHRSHAAELGVNHFLGKPYQEEELLGLITEFLAHKP
jgi:chemosensory pili system protein ChpA (sensor histidine kinase/response regulator)